MKKEDALAFILSLLEPFRAHSRMIKELVSILPKSGIEEKAFTLLLKMLNYWVTWA